MAQIDISRNFEQGEILLEADLDAIQTSIKDFFNTIKVNDDNILGNSINGSDKFINSTVTTATITNSTLESSKFDASAVTTGKLNDLAVTTAKINDLAVTTAKIADSNVTTAKLAAGAVTTVKIASNLVSCAGVTQTESTSGSPGADIATSLSVSITTTGRPVLLALNPTSTSYSTSSVVDTNAVSAGNWVKLRPTPKDMEVNLRRDSVEIRSWYMSHALSTGFTYLSGASEPHDYGIALPPGSFWYIDSPAAGTYVYDIVINYTAAVTAASIGSGGLNSSTIALTNVQLIAVEI